MGLCRFSVIQWALMGSLMGQFWDTGLMFDTPGVVLITNLFTRVSRAIEELHTHKYWVISDWSLRAINTISLRKCASHCEWYTCLHSHELSPSDSPKTACLCASVEETRPRKAKRQPKHWSCASLPVRGCVSVRVWVRVTLRRNSPSPWALRKWYPVPDGQKGQRATQDTQKHPHTSKEESANYWWVLTHNHTHPWYFPLDKSFPFIIIHLATNLLPALVSGHTGACSTHTPSSPETIMGPCSATFLPTSSTDDIDPLHTNMGQLPDNLLLC